MKVKKSKLKKCISEILKLDVKQLSDKQMIKIIRNNLKNKIGKVYIASMNLRGKWAERPVNTECLNVTSAQGKDNKNRRDFSPMTEVKGGYKGYWNFESFWQSGRVFQDIDEKITKNWWLKNKEPKRRYPGSKGKRVLHAHWSVLGNKEMDYLESRKKVYVPFYFDYMKNKEMAKEWKIKVNEGKNVVIYDFDGPRLKNGDPTCHEVTIEYLKEKINDPTFPFGHGYVVSAWLLGLEPEDYIS